MRHTIEYDCKCEACKGSGLYVGFGEKDGFAVVCHTCRGSGKVHVKYTYEDFEGRTDKKGVKQVLECNPGIGVGQSEKLGLTLKSFGGISYEDWKAGKKFKLGTEMRQYTCPAWWYQTADYKKKPEWKECWSSNSFSDCAQFKTKEKCWERFDKEHKRK
ncbi:hypothetical protein ACFLQL_01590 [Verrucomicrobiota bacterium]